MNGSDIEFLANFFEQIIKNGEQYEKPKFGESKNNHDHDHQ